MKIARDTAGAAGSSKSELVLRDLTVQRWPIDKLIPYARNARTHSDAQVAQVAASIIEFGWTNPILVGGDGVIIAGHARLAAARKLGMTEAPVIVLDHLTPTQRRALVLADNRLALNAGWDEEMLHVELESLEEEGFDLDLAGFTGEEIEELLRDPEETFEGLTDDDAIPEEPKRAVTMAGDVWLMGDHRLLCGDATSMEAMQTVLAGGLADMVFTDPPYNVDYEGKTARKLKIGNDTLGGKFYEFLREACANLLAVTKGAVYICMSSSELHTLHQAFTDAGGYWSTFVIWAKHHFTLGRSDYQRQYEPILYGWRKGVDHFWCGARDQGDIWFIKRPASSQEHPTMKPVELVERAIRNSSKTRDTILDPFGGSGTTVIACEKSGRQARLIELEPKYCDVIVRRWQAYSGREAKLESDGRSYREVAGARNAVAA
ncbi:MAG TPA: site-specific DNA-methyltransferase [Bryobacteraceae bacterium]|nr:site-specific DNA-methyltransferase [Bryobacteraceae bacterium]